MHVAAFVSLGARGLFCALALATVVVGASAFAEQPVSPCEGSEYAWWVPDNNIPTHLIDVSLRPNIFLPAREPYRVVPEDERFGPNVLAVTVTDAEGNVITGGVAPADPDRRYDELRQVPRWRPDEDLQPGMSYTLELTVFKSPPNWVENYPNCNPRPGFSRTVRFTVVAEPPEPPTLSLSVAIERVDQVNERFGDCVDPTYDVQCRETDEVCCTRDISVTWKQTATLDIRGLSLQPIYTLVEFDYERFLPGLEGRDSFVHPVRSHAVSDSMVSYSNGPPITGRGCVTAVLRSLMAPEEESTLATIRSCPDGHTYNPPPDLTECDPERCRQRMPPTEPGPEQVEEPSPEEVLADPDPSDDISPETKPSSGCSGGAGGFVGLGWLLWVLRRRGS